MVVRFCQLIAALLVLSTSAVSARADAVIEWNTIWLECVRATGGPPGPIARSGAMLHTAMYEAVNSIEWTHEPFRSRLSVSGTCSSEAAAASAAYGVLIALYPQRTATLNAVRDAAFARIPDGPAKTCGI